MPNRRRIVWFISLSRCHFNGFMKCIVEIVNQILKNADPYSGFLRGKIFPHSRFKRSIEFLHDAGFYCCES